VDDREGWVPGETQIPEKKKIVPELAVLCLLTSGGKKNKVMQLQKLHFCKSRYLGQTVRRASVTRKKEWRATGTHSTMTAVMPE
jgi:hypothetical protein